MNKEDRSIVLLLFLQKQNLANAIYLSGLGTLLTKLEGIITIQKRARETLEDDTDTGAMLVFYMGNDVQSETASHFKWFLVSGEYRERESVCCLLVLNLVSSTLSCIRQPRPRLRVLDVCGFV